MRGTIMPTSDGVRGLCLARPQSLHSTVICHASVANLVCTYCRCCMVLGHAPARQADGEEKPTSGSRSRMLPRWSAASSPLYSRSITALR